MGKKTSSVECGRWGQLVVASARCQSWHKLEFASVQLGVQKQFTSVCKSNINIAIKCRGIQSTLQKLYFEHVRALVPMRGQRGCRGLREGRPGLPRACSDPSCSAELSPAARPLGLRGRNAGWAEGWGEKCEREVCKYQGQRRSTENHCFLSVSWLANCKMWKNTSPRFPWVLGEGRINACEILGYHGNRSLRKGYGEINCLASRTRLNIT